jgi:hypothetical protein
MNSDDTDYKLPQVDSRDELDNGTSPNSTQEEPSRSITPSSKQVDGTVAQTQTPAQTSAGEPDDDSLLHADDLDLIEKAWVEKAKAIVKDTQGDPYAQNKLMSKMKADYLKKRYNRDIKVSE